MSLFIKAVLNYRTEIFLLLAGGIVSTLLGINGPGSYLVAVFTGYVPIIAQEMRRLRSELPPPHPPPEADPASRPDSIRGIPAPSHADPPLDPSSTERGKRIVYWLIAVVFVTLFAYLVLWLLFRATFHIR